MASFNVSILFETPPIIQVNLFERRTLKALFSPDKIPIKQEEAQMSFLL